MMVGTTFVRMSGIDGLSPQFNRGGNGAVFSCQLLDLMGSIGFGMDIDVEHKNSGDTAWTVLASFATMTGVGIGTVSASAIKEQVRFVYRLANGAGPLATDAVRFNMLAPQWRPY